LKYLHYVKIAGEVGAGVIDVVNTVKSGDAEVNKLTSKIEEQEKRVKELNAFDDYLHKTVIPSVGAMGDSLRQAGETMKNQTSIKLNVGKWKVQEMIRDVRLQFKRLSRDFDVHEDLLRVIDKLDETMGILVDVYDRIQVIFVMFILMVKIKKRAFNSQTLFIMN